MKGYNRILGKNEEIKLQKGRKKGNSSDLGTKQHKLPLLSINANSIQLQGLLPRRHLMGNSLDREESDRASLALVAQRSSPA